MTTAPALASGAWQRLFLTLLASWHGDSSEDSPVDEPAGDGSGVARVVFDRLAGLDDAERGERLRAFRRLAATCAERFVHPSWWRTVRAGGPSTGTGSPALVNAWRGERRRRGVTFPTPFPWRLDGARPSTYLWALPPVDARAVLHRHGLRTLADAARTLARTSPRRLGVLAHGLTEVDRRELKARVASLPPVEDDPENDCEGDLDDGASWLRELDELTHTDSSVVVADVPLALARIELAARVAEVDEGERDAAAEDLIRLAYRLPVDLGAPLLAALETALRRPADLPGPTSDEAQLADDVESLSASGDVAPPRLDALRREVAR